MFQCVIILYHLSISVYKSFTFSCYKLLIDEVYSNQSHRVVAFSDPSNTPNVIVTVVFGRRVVYDENNC